MEGCLGQVDLRQRERRGEVQVSHCRQCLQVPGMKRHRSIFSSQFGHKEELGGAGRRHSLPHLPLLPVEERVFGVGRCAPFPHHHSLPDVVGWGRRWWHVVWWLVWWQRDPRWHACFVMQCSSPCKCSPPLPAFCFFFMLGTPYRHTEIEVSSHLSQNPPSWHVKCHVFLGKSSN